MTNPNQKTSAIRRPPSIFGIDASRALTPAPTGTEYYSRALIDALLRLDSPYRFRLYTRAVPPPDFFPSTGNYEIRAIHFPRLWTHLRLSAELTAHPPDVLFVPAHVLPPLHPRNSLVTVHDLGYKFFPDAHPPLQRAYLDASTRWNVTAARRIIADSYTTRADIIKYYNADPAKIRVVYPSYQTDVFKPPRDPQEIARVRQKYSLPDNYLVAVGTLHPRKNYARLIEASVALPAEYSLVIVGKKGWQADSLAARVRELNLTRRVLFLDYAPLQDLPALYAGARLAVFPSLYEGFGIPALEAQACETPLLSSNASSLPEVAGEGALYFDPLSISQMQQAMNVLLKNDDLCQQLVQRGRENLERFSWARAAQSILSAAQTDTDS